MRFYPLPEWLQINCDYSGALDIHRFNPVLAYSKDGLHSLQLVSGSVRVSVR